MPDIHYTPLPVPVNPTPKPPAVLLEEEQAKYDAVLAHFSDKEFKLVGADEGKESLMEQEKMWLTKECIQRYLRATKWVQATAITRLEATLKWRREFGFYDQMTAEYVEPEGLTGKNLVFGFDKDGRPADYLLPSRQNTDGQTRQLQHACYMVERAFDLMGPGVENLVLLINFADKAKHPNMSTARAMLSYLQNHYPERLGRALILNVPFLVSLFFKAVMPFIDPVTRDKIRFNPAAISDGLFVPSQITTDWGGDVQMPYEHDKYWPALQDLCNRRRKQFADNWKRLGGTIGLSEYDLQAGDVGTTNEASEKGRASAPGAETSGGVGEKGVPTTADAPAVNVVA